MQMFHFQKIDIFTQKFRTDSNSHLKKLLRRANRPSEKANTSIRLCKTLRVGRFYFGLVWKFWVRRSTVRYV